jgi:hypothetical protein
LKIDCLSGKDASTRKELHTRLVSDEQWEGLWSVGMYNGLLGVEVVGNESWMSMIGETEEIVRLMLMRMNGELVRGAVPWSGR